MQTITIPIKSAEMIALAAGETKDIVYDESVSEAVEYHVGKNSVLNVIHFITQENHKDVHAAHRLFVSEHATVNFWNIVFGGEKNAIQTEIHLDGESARSTHRTIFFGTGSAASQLDVTHIHNAPNTFSRMESKGIVTDCAQTRYNGMVRMTSNAAGADGMLNQHALMLSDTSKIEAIPGLEIGTNDVRAGHSASMTRVDDEQLFYAASRGITKEIAILMIAEGFLKPMIDTIPDAKMRKRLINMVSDYLIC